MFIYSHSCFVLVNVCMMQAYVVLLCFTFFVLHRQWVFSKSLQQHCVKLVGALFLIAFSHFISLCHILLILQFSSVAQSCPTLQPHESQHTRPPCPSPTPGVHSDSGPLSQWCHPAISSSVVPFSSCPQSLPASESYSIANFFIIIVFIMVICD